MPQFNFANFVPQIAWLALFFAILYFGIVKATLPRLARVIDEREGKVSGDIGAADRAKVEADRVHDAYAAEMARAHAAAHGAVADAKTAATREGASRLADAKAELDARSEQALASLEAARTRAMAEVEDIAATAAADIVHRLSGNRPDGGTALLAARAALRG